MIHLEFDCDEDWLNSTEEGWRNQSVDQWVEWITRPAPEDEVPTIDWLIAVFPRSKKDDGNPDPITKSWENPVVELKDSMKKRCNLKGALVFCPYL